VARADEDDPSTSRLRATAHPLRLSMLSLLTGAELSAAEVARELGVTHANASYHLRFLEKVGLLEVAGEERIRGGVAKRYRHPWRDTSVDQVGADDAKGRGAYVRAMADELVRRHGDRRRKGILVDAELWVDPQVWDEAHELVRRASELLHDAARPPRTEGTLHVNLTAAAFRMDGA
jgi:DNA-binding transcriptional ArsR family regulator